MECDHKFKKFSIAMIGIRWQCVYCDKIAPACFTPTSEAVADDVDEILGNHLRPDPWSPR